MRQTRREILEGHAPSWPNPAVDATLRRSAQAPRVPPVCSRLLRLTTCLVVFAVVSVVLACGCRSTTDEAVGTVELNRGGGYFANAGGRLVFQRLAAGGMELRYSLWLQPRSPVKRALKLEVTFENPEDKSQPLAVARAVPVGETAIEMESPPIWGVRPDHDYEVVVRVHDPSGKLLGTQRLLIRSLVDTRGLQRSGN